MYSSIPGNFLIISRPKFVKFLDGLLAFHFLFIFQAKLFQLYEFCRQQLIKCFREQVVEGVKKAMNALEEIFITNQMGKNER